MYISLLAEYNNYKDMFKLRNMSSIKDNNESFSNNNIEIDFYISTNELNKIQHKSQNNEYFIFEKINARKIYIHHDNLFSGINELSKISQKISAFINSKKNSFPGLSTNNNGR
jgi:hypothetical protein